MLQTRDSRACRSLSKYQMRRKKEKLLFLESWATSADYIVCGGQRRRPAVTLGKTSCGTSGSSHNGGQSSDTAKQSTYHSKFRVDCSLAAPLTLSGQVRRCRRFDIDSDKASGRHCGCDTCTSFNSNQAIGCKRGSGEGELVDRVCKRTAQSLGLPEEKAALKKQREKNFLTLPSTGI